MGMYASYYAIDDSQTKEYKVLLSNNDDDSVEEFFENLEKFDDGIDNEDRESLDKLWDGLHFLLMSFAIYDDEDEVKTPEQIALHQGFLAQTC